MLAAPIRRPYPREAATFCPLLVQRIRMQLATGWLGALMASALAMASHAQDLITVYPAVSAGARCVIEGRVMAARSTAAPDVNDRRRTNLRRSAGALFTRERRLLPVTVQLGERRWSIKTDAEGYFSVNIEELSLEPGWHIVTVATATSSGLGELLIVPPGNRHGLISDVDDTIQITEVNDRSRLLANTFLKNALQRAVVPGVAGFYAELAARNEISTAAPIIYLSASPRQLHTGISQFITHNQLPRGVLITKRITNDATSEPLFDQYAYKTARLVQILELLPQVTFTLIGDDGERDPEVFAAIQRQFPERIATIWIRRVNPDLARIRLEGQGDLNEQLRRFE
jgi:phosphatidate phosphatase APP1